MLVRLRNDPDAELSDGMYATTTRSESEDKTEKVDADRRACVEMLARGWHLGSLGCPFRNREKHASSSWEVCLFVRQARLGEHPTCLPPDCTNEQPRTI